MKIRKNEWLNIQDDKIMYGIQGQTDIGGRWVKSETWKLEE